MALIPCHECSGQVSDHARTCPHCGAPVIATIKRRQKAALIELGVRLAFAVVIVIVAWVMFHHFMAKAMAPLKVMQQQQQPH
jgi:predicted nucleic acid-binding Zn ribbon protein